jgi:hypothetical protein
MSTKHRSRVLLGIAGVAICGWLAVFAAYLWWTFQPVTLPTVDQPIPILNDDKTIAVGEPIVMELSVNKPQPVNVRGADRFIVCESGNLITLTPTAVDLPTGDFVVTSSSVILPAKIIDGDTCTFLYRISYYINPIRSETSDYESEPFTTIQSRGAEHDSGT